MNHPVLGFRSWFVEKEPKTPRELIAPSVRGKYHDDPILDAWFKERMQGTKRTPELSEEPKKQRPRPPVGSLRSLNSAVWRGPVAHFRCRKPEAHVAPDRTCSCGLYANLSVTDLGSWGGNVHGAVIAWGHVIVHGTEGFRSEYQRIVALAPVAEYKVDRALLRKAAQLYGVPLVELARLAMVGGEHGRPITWEYHFG